MTKTATLCCRLTKMCWGSNHVCLLDSGFGYMARLPDLEKNGVFQMKICMKKKGGWSAGSDEENVVIHVKVKKVG